ncbi:MAG: FAD-dependent oxidoreductase [Candidatus Omnitrophica bacterium]|nr:FAD-dependent oxidoreductase [Candidatus Omnitrophota bacterium]
MKKTDVLVVGGGPAGIISAVTARRYYPEKEVKLIKSVDKGVIPCAIPYMFYSLKNLKENALGNAPLEKNNVEVIVDEVTEISPDKKCVTTKKGEEYCYEKLIMAMGSDPVIPPIAGADKENVFAIYKDMEYLEKLADKIKEFKNVLIVGGGFIGVEFADELSCRKELNVSLVEMLPSILSQSFDAEFSAPVKERLEKKGVKLLTGVVLEEILGEKKVEGVKLSGNEKIDVDCVIFGIGASPNTKIAREAGIIVNKGKGVWVDEYMRTSEPDIFAVGDCAGKRDFFTRKGTAILLASTATAEARIAGASLYKLKLIRENKGTIAIYSTYIDGLALGSAGMTEDTAKKEGFEVVVGLVEGVDKHPGTMPEASKVKVKLIFSKQSGIILGGQVAGGMSCGELINVIGVAIQQRVSLNEFETLQMATHPCLTAAPTKYPLIIAAQNASNKM